MKNYCIQQTDQQHWDEISKLIADSIPNAVISSLGIRCGHIYYKKVSQNKYSCCFIALDELNKIIGVIIGTVNGDKSKKITNKDKIKLLLAANIRLFYIGCLKWFLKGILHKFIRRNERVTNLPNAELVAIAVDPNFRGSQLAYDLIKKIEEFMNEINSSEPYVILTEQENLRANKFYSKIGAKLIRTYNHHGRQINEWHKYLKNDKNV